ncbi:MAG TPA: helix-turn-helix domain-containing protein [Bacteroidia bacterium]|nr:helix-turn-helix domain-containing protein [Bacteroidia bacterium]
MKLVIKNMVCRCCTMYVTEILNKLNIGHDNISLNGVQLSQPIDSTQMDALDEHLKAAGLEIVHERKNMIVEKIKSMVTELVNQSKDPLKTNLSVYLSESLHYNYSYLSNLFSESEGMTIREFGIALRIARVKRMLVVEHLDLLEITCRMNYSSVSHLAAQFKKVTGVTTTEFKRSCREESVFERLSA